jgi:Uma2 family endonuclease
LLAKWDTGGGGVVTPDKQRLYTVDEFEAMIAKPENSDRLFELIDGEIVEKVPTLEHGVISGNIFGPVWNFTRERGIGRVAQEVRHRVPGDEHNDRLPDVAYYVDKSRPLLSHGPTPYLPDLAVEVKSPNDSLPKLRAKAQYYLENGCRLVWLVIPDKRLVFVITADDEVIFDEDDTLDGGDVLPGFTLAVREIFS